MATHWSFLAILGVAATLNDLHAQPQNNVCASATTIPMTGTCSPTSGTTSGATQSFTDACAGAANDDVWYQFTVTNEVVVIEVFGSTGFDAVVEVWVPPCSDQNSIACADETANGGDEFLVLDDMTPGDVLIVRVYHFQATDPSTSTFQICVHGPPANDACDDAQALTMGPDCQPVVGDAEWATSGFFGIGCLGNTNSDDDVWYSFTATSGDVQVTVDGDGNATTGYDAVVNLFASTSCFSLDQITCANATGRGGTETLTFQGLVVGNTYLIAVHDAGPGVQQTTTFTICVEELGGGIGMDEGDPESADWSALIPGSGRPLELHFARPLRNPSEVVVRDAAGRTVHRQRREAFDTGVTVLDWVPRTTGMYLVHLELDGATSTTRVIAP